MFIYTRQLVANVLGLQNVHICTKCQLVANVLGLQIECSHTNEVCTMVLTLSEKTHVVDDVLPSHDSDILTWLLHGYNLWNPFHFPSIVIVSVAHQNQSPVTVCLNRKSRNPTTLKGIPPLPMQPCATHLNSTTTTSIYWTSLIPCVNYPNKTLNASPMLWSGPSATDLCSNYAN